MHTMISRQRITWALWKGRVRVCALLLMALCIATGCGSGQTGSASATATNVPPPTATPLPEPTATPLPEPTATPLPTSTPESVSMENIVYYEPGEGLLDRTLTILHPAGGSPPYPWILAMRDDGVAEGLYTHLVDELLSRGYAVVRLTISNNSGLYKDGFCAWAWLEANAVSYGLDIDRALVFNHGNGDAGSLMGLADESVWAERLADCPSPIPSTVHIRGVVTFDGYFLIPEGSLTENAEAVWDVLHITDTSEAAVELVARFVEIPYEEWRTPDRLDEQMQRLATFVPLYYVAGPKPVTEMPAFLLLYSEKGDLIPSSESVAMADALTKAGIPVEVHEIASGTGFWSIMKSDVSAKIADTIDAFAQELFR